MRRVSKAHSLIIEEEAYKVFRQLRWIPHAQSDRMWATYTMKSGWKRLPSGHQGPCVQMSVNTEHWNSQIQVRLGAGSPSTNY
jgi:hypothetical protein